MSKVQDISLEHIVVRLESRQPPEDLLHRITENVGQPTFMGFGNNHPFVGRVAEGKISFKTRVEGRDSLNPNFEGLVSPTPYGSMLVGTIYVSRTVRIFSNIAKAFTLLWLLMFSAVVLFTMPIIGATMLLVLTVLAFAFRKRVFSKMLLVPTPEKVSAIETMLAEACQP